MATFSTGKSQFSRLLDANGTAITSTGGALDINVSSGTVSVDLSATTDTVTVYGNDGGTLRPVQVNGTGRVLTNSTLQVEGDDLIFGQAASIASLPVVIASDQSTLTVSANTIPSVGTHANVWNNEATVTDGSDSVVVDIRYCKSVDIFGTNGSGSGALKVHVSQDGTNFYNTGNLITVLASTNFYGHFDIGARYVRLEASGELTNVTATIAAKV